MGLFDKLTFEDGLDIEFPAIGADPFDITWQTKSIARHPLMMDTYKITSGARLLKEKAAYERVLEEAVPDTTTRSVASNAISTACAGQSPGSIWSGWIWGTTAHLNFTGILTPETDADGSTRPTDLDVDIQSPLADAFLPVPASGALSATYATSIAERIDADRVDVVVEPGAEGLRGIPTPTR